MSALLEEIDELIKDKEARIELLTGDVAALIRAREAITRGNRVRPTPATADPERRPLRAAGAQPGRRPSGWQKRLTEIVTRPMTAREITRSANAVLGIEIPYTTICEGAKRLLEDGKLVRDRDVYSLPPTPAPPAVVADGKSSG